MFLFNLNANIVKYVLWLFFFLNLFRETMDHNHTIPMQFSWIICHVRGVYGICLVGCGIKVFCVHEEPMPKE